MLRYFAKMPAAIGTYSTQNQNNFIAAGGVWPSQFNFTGPQPSVLVWSVLEDIYQNPNTPLWQSLKSFSTPWLLKRDLDPASNDNDPMWLEKAA